MCAVVIDWIYIKTGLANDDVCPFRISSFQKSPSERRTCKSPCSYFHFMVHSFTSTKYVISAATPRVCASATLLIWAKSRGQDSCNSARPAPLFDTLLLKLVDGTIILCQCGPARPALPIILLLFYYSKE